MPSTEVSPEILKQAKRIKLKRRIKKIFILLIIVIILIGISTLRKKMQKPPEEISGAMPVQIARVMAGTVQQIIKLTGEIQAKYAATIFSDVPGRVAKIFKREGELVLPNTELFLIDRRATGIDYQDFPVKSPIAGIVGRNDVEVGYTISTSTQLMKIINPMYMECVANIIERDINLVSLGMEAIIKVDAYKNFFVGRITEISSLVHPVTRTVQIKISIDNINYSSTPLKDGMYANIQLVTSTKGGVPVVPYSAVLDNKGEKYLYTVEKKSDEFPKQFDAYTFNEKIINKILDLKQKRFVSNIFKFNIEKKIYVCKENLTKDEKEQIYNIFLSINYSIKKYQAIRKTVKLGTVKHVSMPDGIDMDFVEITSGVSIGESVVIMGHRFLSHEAEITLKSEIGHSIDIDTPAFDQQQLKYALYASLTEHQMAEAMRSSTQGSQSAGTQISPELMQTLQDTHSYQIYRQSNLNRQQSSYRYPDSDRNSYSTNNNVYQEQNGSLRREPETYLPARRLRESIPENRRFADEDRAPDEAETDDDLPGETTGGGR